MSKFTFMHIGMTVLDLDKMTDFYVKYLGFLPPERTGRFDENFIAGAPTLYRQPQGVYSDSRMLKTEYDLTLELFRFSNVEQSPLSEWHKTGYHHISIKVDDVASMCEEMRKDGIQLFYEPRALRDGAAHMVFFQDPEGNMIEIWDGNTP